MKYARWVRLGGHTTQWEHQVLEFSWLECKCAYPPHRCDSEFPGDSMDTSVITLVGFSPVITDM